MAGIASAGQSMRINSKSQDFDIRCFVGPKRDQVQVTTISNGLGFDPIISSTLRFPLNRGYAYLGFSDAPDPILPGRAKIFASSGLVWINGQMYTYTDHTSDDTSLIGIAPVNGEFVAHPVGSPVVQYYEITNKVVGVSVAGQLDEYSGTWTATLNGVAYDSAVLDADMAVLIQVNVYPDYPSLRVGQGAGGSWSGYTIQPTTVGWSGWKDFFFGYVVQGSIQKDANSDGWSFQVEGTSQYLKRSTAPAHSFGRKNLAKGKVAKTSSVLSNTAWERYGTPGSENEYTGSPDVSGKSAIDEDMGTLWVSGGFPSYDAVGQVEITDPNYDGYPYIDGICTRSPVPGIADKYAQWISFFNPMHKDNDFRKKRPNVQSYENGGVQDWYQDMSICRWVPYLTRQYPGPWLGPDGPDHRADYEIIDIRKLGGRDLTGNSNITIGGTKRVVFCYSKAYFHQIFGELPDVTVVEWGLAYPDWVMDPEKDFVFTADRGGDWYNGHRVWPVGWDGGNSHSDYLDAAAVDGLTWGTGWEPFFDQTHHVWPTAAFMAPPGSDSAGSTHFFRTLHIAQRSLNPGEYYQRRVSGDFNAGYDVTSRPILAQGTLRRTEWIRIDLGEFFTKTTKNFSSNTSDADYSRTLATDSTSGFASSGYLLLDVSLFKYDGKTDTKFSNVDLVSGPNVTHGQGTLVYQTDGDGRLLDIPLVGAIQWRRPIGKSVPNDGDVHLSDLESPSDPGTDPQYFGWKWENTWNAGQWRFADIQASQNTGLNTFEIVLNPPRRARHVAFNIKHQSETPGGQGRRAKLNEIYVYEPSIGGDEAIPLDDNQFGGTGAILKWYLQTKFGLQNNEVVISPGMFFQSLDIAESDYWSIAAQLAERTEHVLICDRFNKIWYKPHPLFGMNTETLPVFFSWTDDTMEQVNLSVLQSNRVGQIILRGVDSTLQTSYTVQYPDSPQAIGTKKTINDLMTFGTNGLIQKAQRHFKYENRPHSLTFKTFIADEIDLGQRHVVTSSVDKSGLKLTGTNFFVTKVQFDISINDDGSKNWSTTVGLEEYPV